MMSLLEAKFGQNYTIEKIQTEDEDLNNFLFSLGCYEGQDITVVSTISENFVISVKDARYNIDRDLAKAILVV